MKQATWCFFRGVSCFIAHLALEFRQTMMIQSTLQTLDFAALPESCDCKFPYPYFLETDESQRAAVIFMSFKASGSK